MSARAFLLLGRLAGRCTASANWGSETSQWSWVVVLAPHRAEAYVASHFDIDAVKSTVPIWKR